MAYNPNEFFGETFPVGDDASIPTFGMPTCVLELGLDALRLLPGNMLAFLTLRANQGSALALSKIAQLKAEILEWLGLKEDEVDGLKFYDLSPGFGGVAGFITEALGAYNFVKGFIDTLGSYYNLLKSELDQIQACLDQLEDSVIAEQGNPNAPITPDAALKNVYDAQIDSINDYLTKTQELLNNINTVIREREQGISLDPNDIIAGVTEDVLETEDEIFRLTYGPPRSSKGTFLLSVDGLYYDSQNRTYDDGTTSPSTEDLKFVPDAERWKLDHAPNLGGKGTAISMKDINDYMDTLLDIEKIDDGLILKEYYEADHLIQTLNGHKNLTIGRLENTKSKIIEDFGSDSAMAVNIQQQIYSEIELYDIKIRKRKKQIELAVKAPDLFGLSGMFAPGYIPVNDFGYLSKVNLSVALEKQRKLVLDQGDVSGVVLPLKPVFVANESSRNSLILAPLTVSPDITGGLADTGQVGTEDAGETPGPAPVLTLTDPIHVSGLIASYNFLDNEVVSNGSDKYLVTNCTGDPKQNAQIVGPSADKVFPKGLGLPRFTGIVNFVENQKPDVLSYAAPSTEVGSYMKLPGSKKMQDLFYNTSGASFDMWLYAPNLTVGNNPWEIAGVGTDAKGVIKLNSEDSSWLDSNYYRLILANENTGSNDAPLLDAVNLVNNFSTKYVRGMVMGFTRDPIFTVPNGKPYTPDAFNGDQTGIAPADTVNDPEKTCLFLAPTQSYSKEGCNFIKADDCNPEDAFFRGLAINLTVPNEAGESLFSVNSKFIHLNVSFDYSNDIIKVYLNGSKLTSGLVNGEQKTAAEFKISDIFGTEPGQSIKVPTFKASSPTANSFEYGPTVNARYVLGPKNDQFFTPWIVGGGWTDGLPTSYQTDNSDQPIPQSFRGGFMGGTGGIYSGFGGHIGSLKIYSTPLTDAQVTKNYTAHRSFFGNIDLG